MTIFCSLCITLSPAWNRETQFEFAVSPADHRWFTQCPPHWVAWPFPQFQQRWGMCTHTTKAQVHNGQRWAWCGNQGNTHPVCSLTQMCLHIQMGEHFLRQAAVIILFKPAYNVRNNVNTFVHFPIIDSVKNDGICCEKQISICASFSKPSP